MGLEPTFYSQKGYSKTWILLDVHFYELEFLEYSFLHEKCHSKKNISRVN